MCKSAGAVLHLLYPVVRRPEGGTDITINFSPLREQGSVGTAWEIYEQW